MPKQLPACLNGVEILDFNSGEGTTRGSGDHWWADDIYGAYVALDDVLQIIDKLRQPLLPAEETQDEVKLTP